MSDSGPTGPTPFGFDPAALARMFSNDGPINWELARMMAGQAGALSDAGDPDDAGFGALSGVFGAAAGGRQLSAHGANIDPLRRIRLEELLRVADLHVAEATGLSTSVTGRPLQAVAVTPAEWASRTLDDYKPLFERLALALTPPASPPDPDAMASGDPFSQLFAGLPQMLGPMLMGFQTGMLTATLAARAFGQYALPVPRPARDELLFVPPTIDAFARAWSQSEDDVSLWVCVHEVAHHAVLGVDHVGRALSDLLLEHAGGFHADASDIETRLSGLDPTDAEGLQRMLTDPETVLGAITTDEQRRLRPRLDALVAVIVGYVDHILDTVGTSLIGGHGAMTEALRRRRVEESASDRFLDTLFGLELTDVTYGRGQRFVTGVLERAGADGLARLWSAPEHLPTPAEVDAPGLWLARIDL